MVEYPGAAALLEGLGGVAWDAAFLTSDPSRLDRVDFTPAYLEAGSTYLVPASSTIADVAAADGPWVRMPPSRAMRPRCS